MPTKDASKDELLTPGEAAKVLGLSVGYVRSLSDAGKIPTLKTRSGRRLFRCDDLEALAKERRKGPGRPAGRKKAPEGRDNGDPGEPGELIGVLRIRNHCNFVWRVVDGYRIVETSAAHCDHCLDDLKGRGFDVPKRKKAS